MSDAAVSSQAAPTARKLAEMVAAYNPEREVVVCVANPAWEQWAALQVGHPLHHAAAGVQAERRACGGGDRVANR